MFFAPGCVAIPGCEPWVCTWTSVCALKPPAHCNKHSCIYLSMCSHVRVKTNKHTRQIYFMCNGAIIQINMLNTIIWVSPCMLTTHNTNTKRGGNTKEFTTWGKYMWKQCYCRCYKVAKAVAPFLTETQWFCIQWHLFLTMNRTSLAWSLHQNDDRIWIHVIANFLKQIGMTHLYISKAEQFFLHPLHQWNADALLRLTYNVAINLKCYTHRKKNIPTF